ncbi:intracellular protein transport protein USO1-like [Prosopis cineraria]|uniref:intracellular protein transport protein USO1-like n=1 Tax=Prosopis cineraria TaxID=364024 RepID=UPI002410220D|nr:intracellular protein transport protein USO1-like [Prosopis cineraria]
MAYNKGNHGGGGGGGNRGRSYALMLLLAFGAALLGVMVLHKFRERRVYTLLLKEKDRDLLALQLFLQKERDHTKEMKRKNEEMKAKIYSLRSQKMELDRRVLEMKSTMDSLKEEQRVMESAFEEKQNEIKMLREKVSDLENENPELIALKDKFRQKEAEMEALKHRFEEAFKSRGVSSNDRTILPESVLENGTMTAQEKTQTENKQRDEQSHDQAANYEDGKSITNEDASKNKLTKFDEDEQNKRKEILQADGGAGVTAKEMDEEFVDGEENVTIREEQRGKFEDETIGGSQEFSLKQMEDNPKIPHDEERKLVRLGRTKGKRWRAIVKNGSLGNNGISKSHGPVSIRSRKLNRDQQDDKNNERGEEEMSDDSPSNNKAEEKVQKHGRHDDIQDGKTKIVDDMNHQVTDNDFGAHPGKQTTWDEDGQSEKQEETGVEQSWSRRHINLVEMYAGQEKTPTLHKELEKPKAADVQEKDDIEGRDDEDKNDDFSEESQSNLADENEHKGEMH